jgi:hypothetical protein
MIDVQRLHFRNPSPPFGVFEVHHFLEGPVHVTAEIGYLPVDPI